jgi:hypothetical protein
MKLNFEQIQDTYTRDNFRLIEQAINDLVFYQGEFKFFEFEIKGAIAGKKLYHHMGIRPEDVIITKSTGASFQLDYNGFTQDYITVNTSGDCYLRMFIGNMRGTQRGGLQSAIANLTDNTSVGGATNTSGAGGTPTTATFVPWDMNFYTSKTVVTQGLIDNRDIVIGHVPWEASITLALNGIIEEDSSLWSVSTNVITIDPAMDLYIGDEVTIKYAERLIFSN